MGTGNRAWRRDEHQEGWAGWIPGIEGVVDTGDREGAGTEGDHEGPGRAHGVCPCSIGENIQLLVDRPDGTYCFRLHRDRVYYLR